VIATTLLVAPTVVRAANPAAFDVDDFGSPNGYVRPGPAIQSYAEGIARQDDGKLVVVGAQYPAPSGYEQILVMRLNTDGSLDTDFGSGGIVLTPLQLNDRAYDVAIQVDGKIVVGATSTDNTQGDFAILRYLSDGTLDTTFGGGDGIVFTDFIGTSDTLRAITIQPNGFILAVGDHAASLMTPAALAMARYDLDGDLDETFDGDGKVTFPATSGNFGELNDVVVEQGTQILVAGRLTGTGAIVMRFDMSGILDTSFGTNGIATLQGSDSQALALAVDPDDHDIIVGGVGSYVLWRLLVTGQPNTDFGTNGAIARGAGLSEEKIKALLLQPNGRIVTIGDMTGTEPNAAAKRYFANGIIDTSFDNDGIKGLTQSYGLDGLLQPDGKIVAATEQRFDGIENWTAGVTRLVGDCGEDACDVIDPCLGGDAAEKPVTKLTKLLAPAGDEQMKVSGTFTLAPTPPLNPLVDGLRATVNGANGVVFDATAPPGAYDPLTKTGWKVNAKQTAWKYTAPKGSPIKLAKLTASSVAPGTFKVLALGGGAIGAGQSDLPLSTSIVIGSAIDGECTVVTPTCTVAPNGATINCK
jgi:uncharacterized delta-60 repeat protein